MLFLYKYDQWVTWSLSVLQWYNVCQVKGVQLSELKAINEASESTCSACRCVNNSKVTLHVNGNFYAYCNNISEPSSDELKKLMMLHGGSYEHYLSRTKVTHVIATNLPNSKVKQIRGLKVVRPEWITER